MSERPSIATTWCQRHSEACRMTLLPRKQRTTHDNWWCNEVSNLERFACFKLRTFVTNLFFFDTPLQKKLIRRWDSKRELALRRHRKRTTKYNRLMHKFRHRSTRLCVGTQVYRIQWNNAMQRPLRHSKTFKVTDFGTDRKLIYDFLLVINANVSPMLHRFQVMAD